MDSLQLLNVAYNMKKKSFERGEKIVEQGERMESAWLIKEGSVRISHKVVPPNSFEEIQQGLSNGKRAGGRTELKQVVSIDLADLGTSDIVGLVELLDESAKKSQREVIAVTNTDMFHVP